MPLRITAICGLLAPVAFALGVLLGDLAQPDAYSPANDSISDLGALTASSPWLYNQLGANLTGLLVIAFGLGLWSALAPNALGAFGAAWLVAFGAAFFLDGIFRLDCQGFDPGCVNSSWHADAHRYESGFTSVAFVVAPILLAFGFRRIPTWRPIWIPTLLAIPAVLVASAVASVAGPGAAGRVASLAWFAWLALAAAWLLRVVSRGGSRPAS